LVTDLGKQRIAKHWSWIVLGWILLLLVVLYWRVMRAFVQIWWTDEETSYGLLVPLISIYLIWQKRKQLVWTGSALGLGSGLISLAGILLMAGTFGAVAVLGPLSLIVMAAGLVLCLWGWKGARALAFPLGYLFFMLPLFDWLVSLVNRRFQLMTATMSAWFLQLVGFHVWVDREFIVLPDLITLKIASACSGVRYLIAIVVIGLPVAYLRLKSWWGRLTLIEVAVIIGTVANWVRVAMLAIWAHLGGEINHEPFHTFEGLFVAVAGYGTLLLGAALISKVEKSVGAAANFNSIADSEVVDEPSPGIPEKRPSYRAQAITAFLLSLIVAAAWVPHRGPVQTKRNLMELPSSIGEWVEESPAPEAPLITVWRADQQILKVYRDREGIRIRLFVAYFETQCEGKEVVNSLLTPLSQPLRRMELAGEAGRLSLNQSAVKDRAGQEYRLVFWYDLNGRMITSKLRAKIATIWDALVRARTNGALVIVYSEGSGSQAAGQEARFVKDVIQVLRQFLP
jgi:EpsI family protein